MSVVYQVVVFPPDDVQTPVEAFRRLHAPAFHRLSAHLPLLPPFEAPDAGLLERFDAFASQGAFEVSLGPAEARGRALVLPVSDGALRIEALRKDLAAALLPPLEPEEGESPAVRLGLFASESELELARRTAQAVRELPSVRVNAVTLLLQDERGIWHEVRTRRLR